MNWSATSAGRTLGTAWFRLTARQVRVPIKIVDLRTDGLFIRAQSTIRADGCVRATCSIGVYLPRIRFHVPQKICALRRANRVCCTDKKHPYSKRGSGNNKQTWVLDEIVDCVRMAFHPCAIDDPRDGCRPRNVHHRRLSTAHTVLHATNDLRAARANRVFCTDRKHPCRKHGFC